MTGEVSVFHRSSFSTISFSRTAWAGIKQDEQSGRSGYWRLFYHQLQEQALKDSETKKRTTEFVEPYSLTEAKDGSATIVFPGKAKPRKFEPATAIPELPPLPPRPKVSPPETPNFMVFCMNMTMQLRFLLQTYGVNLLTFTRQVKMTSDEDEDIELLLLMA